MKLILAIAMLVATLPAAAEFSVIEETESATVYRDGDQVIVLADAKRNIQLHKLVMARSPTAPWSFPIWDRDARKAGVKAYWGRTRLLDGVMVCEKIAARPETDEQRRYIISLIAPRPCSLF